MTGYDREVMKFLLRHTDKIDCTLVSMKRKHGHNAATIFVLTAWAVVAYIKIVELDKRVEELENKILWGK